MSTDDVFLLSDGKQCHFRLYLVYRIVVKHMSICRDVCPSFSHPLK